MASALPAPRVIGGKYAVGRVLGSGTQGTVYEAENLLVGRKVAVKVMSRELALSESLRHSFLTEARITARVAHPNVVDVIDLGIDREGIPFIVMELLEGETLAEILAARGPLPLPYACELMAQVLEALATAHREGIVHCDLKPSNVFVTHPRPDLPVVKVFDFGIAEGGGSPRPSGAGTPLYMAPEQATGGALDARADVFAAGALLYEMITGEPPFPFDSLRQIVLAARGGNFEPVAARVPAVPADLSDAISRALAGDPDQRFEDADEFLAEVERHATGNRRRPSTRGTGAPIPLVGKADKTQQPRPDSLHIPRAPRMPSLEDLEYTDEGYEDEADGEQGPPPGKASGWRTAVVALGAGFAIGGAACVWMLN